MFSFGVALFFLALGLIPLIVTNLTQQRGTPKYKRWSKVSVWFFVIVFVVVILFSIFTHYYTEYLWFANLGYENRFLIVLFAKILLFTIGLVISGLFLLGNMYFANRQMGNPIRTSYAVYIAIAGGIIFGLLFGAMWEQILYYIYQAPSQVQDPIFAQPINFYLFSLPFYSVLITWIIGLLILTFIVVGGLYFYATQQFEQAISSGRVLQRGNGVGAQLFILVALGLFILGWNTYLDIFRLMYSTDGAVYGAGYTDVTIRVPVYYVILAVYVITGVLLLVSAFSYRFRQKLLGLRRRSGGDRNVYTFKTLILPATALVVIIIATQLVPALVNALVVNPNEITLERPYIQNNIKFTQNGYAIGEKRIETERYPLGDKITQDVVETNTGTIENVRLWDWRALMDNLREQQEIRLYYRFHDVDIGRYNLNGDYRQVMLAVREISQDDLDPRSQNWVSQYLKYTHGYGLVLLPVHEFLPQGKPNLLIRNIPPQEKIESLEITRPQIYYGEKTTRNVYVKTTEEEFDYPMGQENIYTEYEGDGGVSIGSLFRRFLFALKFDDYKLLLSSYFTEESRTLFHRDIIERVTTITPFLVLDGDPYAVITEEGAVKYMIDTYTISEAYPYSQRYRGFLQRFHGINYMRNAVKAVVDAYHGTVDYYIADDSDIIIQTFNNIFPGVFKTIEQMPRDEHRHIRYPVDYFTIQSEMYSAYHMDNPDVFYQREDLWQFATERYRENFQRVLPYYIMMQFPDKESIEYILIVPFTPKNKNVLNAWMAARCDPPNYGEIEVFTFPKGVEVLGPSQIEARIDQDSEMSRTLSLWGQRGSEVIRGNLLVIPLFYKDTLFIMYSEPIYLQAENGQLPEIKRVALADQERVVWADNFETSLRLLIGEKIAAVTDTTAPGIKADLQTVESLLQDAREYFESYRQASSEGDFGEAGNALDNLEETLERIENQTE